MRWEAATPHRRATRRYFFFFFSSFFLAISESHLLPSENVLPAPHPRPYFFFFLAAFFFAMDWLTPFRRGYQ